MATEYVVLEELEGDVTYALAGEVEAHSPIAAAKQVSDKGSFLVVPKSNAHVVHLTSEQPPPRVVGEVGKLGSVPMRPPIEGQQTLNDEDAG